MKYLASIAVLLALGCGGTTKAAAPAAEAAKPESASGPALTLDEVKGRRVVGVDVKGLDRVSPGKAKAALRVKAGQVLELPNVVEDVQELWALGQFDDVRAEARLDGDGVRLVYVVSERPLISDIRIEGNMEASALDLLPAIALEKGAVLSWDAIRKSRAAVEELYRKRYLTSTRVPVK